MNLRTLLVATLAACVLATVGCSRRYLEPPVEVPVLDPPSPYATYLTDARANYVVDVPIVDEDDPAGAGNGEDVEGAPAAEEASTRRLVVYPDV